MQLVVCVKRVPEVAEAEVRIDDDGMSIRAGSLVFDASEADQYALEAALRLKEQHGGTVTVVTVAGPEADAMLRTCLAKGADQAVLVADEKLRGVSGLTAARVLAKAIAPLTPDLVITGAIASDDGAAVVPGALAHYLGLPHASYVAGLEIADRQCRVTRELEGGLAERFELTLPALIAVQTGINEPRYASLRGMRKARETQIPVATALSLGLTDVDLAADTALEGLSGPDVRTRAETISGSPEEVAARLLTIFREKGVL